MVIRFATFLAPVLYDTYAFIADYLGEHLACLTTLHVGHTLTEFAEGTTDSAFLCGLLYVTLARQASGLVEPLVAPVLCESRYQGQAIYYSDVVVRRNSPYRNFADLHGCSWAYNERASHSGYNLVRYSLLERGTDLHYFGVLRETGSHRASLQMVLDGQADATALDSHMLVALLTQSPELVNQIRIIDSFGPSPMPPLVVAQSMENSTKQRLQEALCTMHHDKRAATKLRAGMIDHFVAVKDADYDPIRAMYERVQHS